MDKPGRVSSPIYNFFPVEVEGFDSLAELALDMRWSWNHSADEVWRRLDPALWELTYNPWVILQTATSTAHRCLRHGRRPATRRE